MAGDKQLCKVCGIPTKKIFKTKILNKYEIQYYQCSNCLFIQTEAAYWLKEAYETPMDRSDTGVLQRNILFSLKTSLLIHFLFNKKGRYLDYAGGWGVFTRLMRDRGFDFYWYDPYTENKFARGFEGELDKKYELITLFEGFEHFDNPREEFKKIFKLSNNILFSTELVPKPTPNPKEWWYYGLNHGQHIAFYSKETLEHIAQEYSFFYHTNGNNIHLFSKQKIPRVIFRFLTSKFGLLLLPFVFYTNKSRSFSDYEELLRRKV